MAAWEKWKAYAEKPARLVVGLMSGTSVDGVDAALVRVSGCGRETTVQVMAFTTMPFPRELQKAVLSLSHNRGNTQKVSQTNFALGELFAEAAEAVLRQAEVSPEQLDAVASHGQTISHMAPPSRKSKRAKRSLSKTPATLQIAEPAVIAQRLGCVVVSNFRTADMAAGGHGAPLVPYADWCLLTHGERCRAVQNIGGIGNVTYLPANARPEQVIGFDTGPGNMLIDRAVQWATRGKQSYDAKGLLAAEGTLDTDLLEWLLSHKFLVWKPPKSAGREDFGERYWGKIERWLEENRTIEGMTEEPSLLTWKFGQKKPRLHTNDVIRTLTVFTAVSIAEAYAEYLPEMPDEVIVGGGGARNPTLMRLLKERVAPVPVCTHEEQGINSDAKEAMSFALLANETLLGNPSNLPSVTGASRPVTLGTITLP